MGRHAADRPGRPPLHADLFAPAPGTAAAYAARERAAEAFDRLVEPHRDALEAYVLRLTDGDRAAADSVLKETFYRAAQDPARYPPRASAVRPWLVLTARTVLRDGERSAPAGHDDRPVAVPAERSPSPLGETTVVGAMNDLADAHREILVELFYRGVSLEAAAAARGVPVATLKSRLYFAMRALRAVLDQRIEPGPDPRHRR
ncbi:RNA polymerase subunit sigma [Couchioplanes caeruleus]|uniref:sigma factor-like helix-turn-helix DNA-binding protein n=1 Tax=Couchioplanes caeruleus TaxID=56438 RepID=UPI0020BDEF85|nr:sigma factor-like helix-turn-helix DNA-binding protein [Couchioplanes caeruleus]UQU66719.1 RNA polymerase subunit sigma [Couchioplanes caeruleus]